MCYIINKMTSSINSYLINAVNGMVAQGRSGNPSSDTPYLENHESAKARVSIESSHSRPLVSTADGIIIYNGFMLTGVISLLAELAGVGVPQKMRPELPNAAAAQKYQSVPRSPQTKGELPTHTFEMIV